jgi:hypothetical protein
MAIKTMQSTQSYSGEVQTYDFSAKLKLDDFDSWSSNSMMLKPINNNNDYGYNSTGGVVTVFTTGGWYY